MTQMCSGLPFFTCITTTALLLGACFMRPFLYYQKVSSQRKVYKITNYKLSGSLNSVL